MVFDVSSDRALEDSAVALSWQTRFPERYVCNCWLGWQLYEAQKQNFWVHVVKEDYALAVVATDEIIDAQYAESWSKNSIERLLYCFAEPLASKEEELELEVAKRFKGLDEVELIYVDVYMEDKRFKIFTSNTRYDDQLMDRLLEVECDLKSMYRDSLPRFEYVPRIYDRIDEVIRKGSKLIYRRGYHVVFSSSSLASSKKREISEAIA